jgi:hypothetical protein
MTQKTYRIRIGRGDHLLEAEGDKAFVLEMLKRYGSTDSLLPAETPVGKRSGPSNVLKSTPVGKSLSVGEFIRQLGFKRHTDIVLAFGYYLEQQGLKDFTPADINKCYYDAKMESSNTSQAFIYNIRHGYMMEAKGSKGARKRYTLTGTGEDYIKGNASKKPA